MNKWRVAHFFFNTIYNYFTVMVFLPHSFFLPHFSWNKSKSIFQFGILFHLPPFLSMLCAWIAQFSMNAPSIYQLTCTKSSTQSQNEQKKCSPRTETKIDGWIRIKFKMKHSNVVNYLLFIRSFGHLAMNFFFIIFFREIYIFKFRLIDFIIWSKTANCIFSIEM